MTWVENVDGGYWAADPRDHCKHGVYVGGCGYDFMCGACEDGEPDPTPRDLVEGLARYLRKQADHAIVLVVDEEAIARLTARVNQRRAEINEALKFAASMDDDQWMRTRHEAQIREFMENS